MKYILWAFSIISLVSGSCVPSKNNFVDTGNQKDTAILIAVNDFANNSKLYKRDSVFVIWSRDTLYNMVLQEENGNYRWVRGKINSDVLTVSIASDYNKLPYTEDSKNHLPSRIIEKDRKLFYWWDRNFPITEEVLNVYRKYGILEENVNLVNGIPEYFRNDAQKGAHYYFCKNDLSKYKKTITNKGLGYYNPPNLNCK